PNTQNFRDIVQLLLDAHGAEVVRDPVELTAFVQRMLDDPAERERLGKNARELVAQQLGATERTWQLLQAYLPQSDESPQTSGSEQLAARGSRSQAA
ncbi:MAG: glycosyltransferase, partial [Planctomycetaceae bacterium]|nr:glycosyltransferase [Planctomycetaceae bacterium]